MPPAQRGGAIRPGELDAGQPTGALFGRPGPNVGYALTLAGRLRDRLSVGPHESRDDAVAVVAELAMRRAASFGRAPLMADLERAAELLGYLGTAASDFVTWRSEFLHDAAHDYGRRRIAVDSVPEETLRGRTLSPADVEAARDVLRAVTIPS